MSYKKKNYKKSTVDDLNDKPIILNTDSTTGCAMDGKDVKDTIFFLTKACIVVKSHARLPEQKHRYPAFQRTANAPLP